MSWRSDCHITFEVGHIMTLGTRRSVGSVCSSAAVLWRIHCQSSWVTIHVSLCSRMSVLSHGTHLLVVCRRMLCERTWLGMRPYMNPVPRCKRLVGKAESRGHFPKSLTKRNYDIWRGFFSYHRHCLSKIWQMRQLVQHSETQFLSITCTSYSRPFVFTLRAIRST